MIKIKNWKVFGLFLFIIVILIIIVINFILLPARKPSSPVNPQGEVVKQTSLSFAVIGDPESDTANLAKALTKIKEKGIKTVVLMGDLTQTGTPEQFSGLKQTLDQSDLYYLVIPGNHDLWYGRKVCLEKGSVNCTNLDTYKQYFGNSYAGKTINQYEFLLLDDSDEWLGLGQEQLNWFSQQFFRPEDDRPLAEAINYQQLIFLHIPLYHPESEYVMGYQNPELKQEAQDLLTKFCAHPPLAIFNGHLHHTNQYEYTCPDKTKLKMVSAGSINSQRNWQIPRFLEVRLEEGNQLQVEEIELGE